MLGMKKAENRNCCAIEKGGELTTIQYAQILLAYIHPGFRLHVDRGNHPKCRRLRRHNMIGASTVNVLANYKPKQLIGLGVAAFVLVATFFIPEMGGLNVASKNLIGIIIAILVIWMTDALPLGIASMLLIALIPLYDVMPAGDTFKEFMSPVVFFVLATYSISIAFTNTPIGTRLTKAVLKWAGGSTSKILLGFTAVGALVSSIMSNLPVVAMLMGIALGLLNRLEMTPGKTQFGKALMLACTFGPTAGGMATPAAASPNILAIGLLEKTTGMTVTFVDWMVLGIPLTILMIPVIWFCLKTIFKCETISEQVVREMIPTLETPKRLTADEIKTIIIVGAMVVLWIASSWIPAINTTIVAMVGCVAFFVPGINIMTWPQYRDKVGWHAILLVGSVTAMGGAFVSCGLADILVAASVDAFTGLNLVMLVAGLGLLIALLHFVMPVAPAIIGILLVPLVAVATTIGIPPEALVFVIAISATACYLIPFDTVPALTFTEGYYTMIDMLKAGTPITIVLVILCAIWVPIGTGLMF